MSVYLILPFITDLIVSESSKERAHKPLYELLLFEFFTRGFPKFILLNSNSRLYSTLFTSMLPLSIFFSYYVYCIYIALLSLQLKK